VRWQPIEFASEPRRLGGPQASSFRAEEFVIPTVADEHCLGTFDAQPLHSHAVDLRLRLGGSNLKREYGRVEAF
jgi:hypothetical protein